MRLSSLPRVTVRCHPLRPRRATAYRPRALAECSLECLRIVRAPPIGVARRFAGKTTKSGFAVRLPIGRARSPSARWFQWPCVRAPAKACARRFVGRWLKAVPSPTHHPYSWFLTPIRVIGSPHKNSAILDVKIPLTAALSDTPRKDYRMTIMINNSRRGCI